MEVPKELPLLAFSKREDPRDVLVLPEGVAELDPDKPLGCSSLRKMCIRDSCCKRQKEKQRFLMSPVHSFSVY